MTLPKTVFTYWHQGFDKAPPIVRACLSQLKKKNPGWNIYALDERSVQKFVSVTEFSGEKIASLNLAHRSDLIRTRLLIDHGGVWIDPTVFVTQAFDDWLLREMNAGLFLFSNPGRDRIVSNWFIASNPGHPILIRLYDTLCSYWEDNRFRNHGRPPTDFERLLHRAIDRNLVLPALWFSWPFRKVLRLYPYMVYHYLFGEIVRNDQYLGSIFSKMPILSADGPHRLQRLGLGLPYSSKSEMVLDDKSVPLHKLSHELDLSEVGRESVIGHLIDLAGTAGQGEVFKGSQFR